MQKYFLIIALITLCSCQKQAQPIAEQRRAYIDLQTAEGRPSQEPTISHDTAVALNQENSIEPNTADILNQKIYSQEDIIGTWLQGTPFSFREIEFTDSNIFYLREFDRDYSIIDENFYSYKIEGKNLIINDASKSNNFGYDINKYFLSSGEGVYIGDLSDRRLYFEIPGASFLFYKGSMDDFLGREAIRLSYENKLKDFIHNEMLNGIIFQEDTNDENAVTAIYGEPIKDEIIEYSGGLGYESGGHLTSVREITYDDLIHRYYVYPNGFQTYIDIVMNKNIDRLTIPCIGYTSEEVLELFGSSYWRKEGEDLIYMWGSDSGESYRWVRFAIENDIVVSVAYILTSRGK
jgi:hypothetical protein